MDFYLPLNYDSVLHSGGDTIVKFVFSAITRRSVSLLASNKASITQGLRCIRSTSKTRCKSLSDNGYIMEFVCYIKQN